MLKVEWFDRVTGEVDSALDVLPAGEVCPNSLYRALLAMPRRDCMRIAVVSEAGVPVAVTGLVRRSRLVWEPVSNWLYPGSGFPAADARHVEALGALGLEIPLAWWRMMQPVPSGRPIQDVEIKPTFRMDKLGAREDFWRSTDYLRHIKNIRNRTRALEVRYGVPEIATQVVGGWHEKWTGGHRDDDLVRSRAVLAEALEPLGRHVTVGLFDNGTLAAGSTNFVHRGALVAGISYLAPEYRKLGGGVRLIDAVFETAERLGLSGFDLGSGAEYKKKWAPAAGERGKFTIVSPHVRLMRNLVKTASLIGSRVSGAARVHPANRPQPAMD